MPFITEEIYTHLSTETESITIATWPTYDEALNNEKAEKDMTFIMEDIRSLRNLRAEMNVPPSRKAKVMAYASEEAKDAFINGGAYLEKLASASEVTFLDNKDNLDNNLVSVVVSAIFRGTHDDLVKNLQENISSKIKCSTKIN